jgi:hypothetical protein
MAWRPKSRVVIGHPRSATDGGRTIISASTAVGDAIGEIWYRIPEVPTTDGTEAFLAAALLPAMALGGELCLPRTASPRLLDALPTIQDIYHAWNSDWHRSELRVRRAAAAPQPEGEGVACFFSGGVDSFYTLLKRREEITHLVFVHGFDIRLEDHALRRRVSAAIQAVSTVFQKSLIEVETNVRDFADRWVPWDFYHGAALASVALLLSHHVRRIYIAASHSYRHLIPNGSHPLLDPLWSTEAVQVLHDGCEATRLDKVARIAQSDVALNTLRVCWENPEGAYNCGRCRKCLTTMANLLLVGALQRCATFDRPLNVRALSRMGMSANTPFLLESTLEMAEKTGHTAVARALRDCLSRRFERPFWRAARAVRNFLRRFPPRFVNG